MRHAFLIMAHNKWDILIRLLKKLDHVDNSIYLHIDSKSNLSREDEQSIASCCKKSDIVFVSRNNVAWGGYSLANCELRLMEIASHKKYDYYHFMSGIDFPIKPMEYIHKFFVSGNNREYIHFADETSVNNLPERYNQYHFLQEYVGRKSKGAIAFMERLSLFIQRNVLKINRSDKYKDLEFKVGSQWCSLTHESVTYLLSKEDEIKRIFKYSSCSDELFVQTMLYNSPLKEKICFDNLRSIDWKRGNPYVYTKSDYEELLSSRNLFCRKVDDSTMENAELINKLELL